MRIWVAPLLLSVLLTGCGDGGDDTSAATDADGDDGGIAICRTAAPVDVAADLDGDGAADKLEFLAPVEKCPGAVRLGEDSIPWDVDRPVTAREFSTVRVNGHRGDLVLQTFNHPRGGFEARLYAAVDGKPREITRDGGPLIPFVATDAPTQYVAVTCTSAGFSVLAAAAQAPAGAAPAWDVRRTDYAGKGLVENTAVELAENVPDDGLRDFPGLTGNKLFAGCAR